MLCYLTISNSFTAPPPPLNKLELLNLDISHNSVRFNIRRDAFNSTNGPILTIAVIVTKDENGKYLVFNHYHPFPE